MSFETDFQQIVADSAQRDHEAARARAARVEFATATAGNLVEWIESLARRAGASISLHHAPAKPEASFLRQRPPVTVFPLTLTWQLETKRHLVIALDLRDGWIRWTFKNSKLSTIDSGRIDPELEDFKTGLATPLRRFASGNLAEVDSEPEADAASA